MTSLSAKQALKLGIHLEYLRGIASSSGPRPAGIDDFGYLQSNEPTLRYAAKKTAAVVKSLLTLLEDSNLTKSLEAAAEFRPMLAEVEEFVGRNASPETVYLNDHFADSLVRIAENVLKELREEIEA